MKTNYVGIGFPGLLTIALIVLKLTGYIDWGWWIVTAPMWAPVSIIILISIISLFIGIIKCTNNKK